MGYHTPRGICPTCRQELALKADGTIRGHLPPGTAQNPWSPATWCQGSWEQPALREPEPETLHEDGFRGNASNPYPYWDR